MIQWTAETVGQFFRELTIDSFDEADDLMRQLCESNAAAFCAAPEFESASHDISQSILLRYATAAITNDIAVWDIDIKAKRAKGNKALCDLYGIDPSELKQYNGRRWEELYRVCVHPDDRKVRNEVVAELLSKAQHFGKAKIVNRIIDPSQSTEEQPFVEQRYVTLQGRLFCDCETNEPIRLLGIVHDCTAARLLEMERLKADHLAEKVAMQETYNLELKQYTDYVMHEARSLLTGIEGACVEIESILQDLRTHVASTSEDLTRKINELNSIIDSMQECIEHQKSVLNSALSLSKLEAGQVELKPEPFYLNDLIRSVVTMMQHASRVDSKLDSQRSYRRSAVELSCRFEDREGSLVSDTSTLRELHDTSLRLQGDASFLKQILVNLVGNALKFCEQGQVTVRVRMLEETDDFLSFQVSVQDTGIGIPQDVIERGVLFKRFKQLSSREYKGTGLGLLLCKQMLQLFDPEQQIHVESTEGVGSAFSFRLTLPKYNNSTDSNPSLVQDPAGENSSYIRESQPEAEASARPPPAPGEVVPGAASASVSTAPLGQSKGTIVIIDDNAMVRKLLERFVQQSGFQSLSFEDGQDFLDFYQKQCTAQSIHLVLMDANMPRLDGFETVRQLRRLEQNHDTDRTLPICCLSGYADQDHKDQALAVGFNDYLTKPFTREQVSQLLSRFKKGTDQSSG